MQAAFRQTSFFKVFVSQRQRLQANWEHRRPPAIKRQREDADALTSLNSAALANQPPEGGSHSTGMWLSPGDAGVRVDRGGGGRFVPELLHSGMFRACASKR